MSNMEAFEEVLSYLPDFGVLLCKQCQFAIVPTQIETHLRTHHPLQTQQKRKAIQEQVHRVEGVAHERHQVRYPSSGGPPVPGLPVFQDAFCCQECPYVCRHVTGIQKHCKEQHRWSNPQKRGRQKRGERQDMMWEEGQHC